MEIIWDGASYHIPAWVILTAFVVGLAVLACYPAPKRLRVMANQGAGSNLHSGVARGSDFRRLIRQMIESHPLLLPIE
ncbi:MAG TPA: hypothetical protein VNZ53_20935 [Steroidobacteraceae bacterium]|jgi:hypothetical protein|nr:hypothetical protein [Steroidobacteraceae bacterium]